MCKISQSYATDYNQRTALFTAPQHYDTSQGVLDDTNVSESSDEDSATDKSEELKIAPNTMLVSQFEELRRKHPDAILLFRCGDYYEIYDDQAEIAAKILGITPGIRHSVGRMITRFPHHALDTYLPRLIRAGQRVAICDQLDNPMNSSKLVKRGITELVSSKGV